MDTHTHTHTHAHWPASWLPGIKNLSVFHQLTLQTLRHESCCKTNVCGQLLCVFRNGSNISTGSVRWWRLVSFQWTPAHSKRHRRAESPILVHEALALCYGLCVLCCECRYAYSVYSVTPIRYADSDAGFCRPVRLITRQPILLLMLAF